MTVIQGILLGALQGVAEFLPISSSGHLAVAQNLFGLDEVPLLFDVFLHLATLFAVVLYFRKSIWNLLKIFGRWITRKSRPEGTEDSSDLLCGTDKAGQKTILAVIITTAITGAIGIVTSKLIPELSIKVTCAGFLVTSVLLIVSALLEKKNNSSAAESPKGISIVQSVVIGFMQGFGTLPGISRSGSTIAGALFCGVNRKVAGDFSFIVSIPAILGAFILEVKDLGEVNQAVGAAPVIAGCAAAFAVGYVSLTFLMKLIRKGKLVCFAAYLIPAGILGMIFLH
ncbi:MAG: undecaprenyl-diphosphate phosphatase [Treponema sp.]|nr:undecaprenyl-diphosphate phosphatase [Treponema sp.]